MQNENINASTCLWLGFKEPIKKDYVLHLHSRQVTINEVSEK
jgi:hypothetical protein